jgi:hypothetical protein
MFGRDDRASRSSRPRSRSSDGGGNCQVHVKNLSYNTPDRELRNEFARHGRVTDARIVRTADGHSKGFGFVTFETVGEAQRAIQSTGQTIVAGRALQIEAARTKPASRARTGDWNCSSCYYLVWGIRGTAVCPVCHKPRGDDHAAAIPARDGQEQEGSRHTGGSHPASADDCQDRDRSTQVSPADDAGDAAARLDRRCQTLVDNCLDLVRRVVVAYYLVKAAVEPIRDAFLRDLRAIRDGVADSKDPSSADRVRPPDCDTGGSDWWRQSQGHESMEQALAHECGPDVGTLHRSAPCSRHCAWVPMANPPPAGPGTTAFYVSDSHVVKVYNVGSASVDLRQGENLLNYTAAACQDAAATSCVCGKMGWYHQSFGLFFGGSAYVCVVRRWMSPTDPFDPSAADLVALLARRTGVVHNDGHWLNVACWLSPATQERQFEVFDLERASWYGLGGAHPPAEFLKAYNRACAVRSDKEKRELMGMVDRAGLRETRLYFMRFAHPHRVFGTAFDGLMFERSPVGRWPPGK